MILWSELVGWVAIACTRRVCVPEGSEGGRDVVTTICRPPKPNISIIGVRRWVSGESNHLQIITLIALYPTYTDFPNLLKPKILPVIPLGHGFSRLRPLVLRVFVCCHLTGDCFGRKNRDSRNDNTFCGVAASAGLHLVIVQVLVGNVGFRADKIPACHSTQPPTTQPTTFFISDIQQTNLYQLRVSDRVTWITPMAAACIV